MDRKGSQGYNRYSHALNNPLKYTDPDGENPFLIAVGAAIVNGLINVGTQALQGNVKNVWQGLEYFGVGAAAGIAYVVPGGGAVLAGSIQAGGNKIVQAANGQWDPRDISSWKDVGKLALEVGFDFTSPGLGAGLGEGLANAALLPVAQRFGWVTKVTGGGSLIRTGGAVGDVAFSVALDESLIVTASRTGANSGIASGLGGVAGNAAKGVPKTLYHYTSKEAAASISKNGLRVGKDGFSYLTNNGTLKPLQTQIELALPANRTLPNSVLQINTKGLNPSIIRRVQGNLPGYGAGGGTEFLFNQHIPASAIKILR